MLGLDWLAWYLRFLKKTLAGLVDNAVSGIADSNGDTVAEVFSELYEDYTAILRMAWFGSVLFHIAQAREEGTEPGYIPAAHGIAPRVVTDMIRKELRPTRRGIVGSKADIARRLTNTMGDFIHLTQREYMRDIGEVDAEEIARIQAHRDKYGHPLENLYKDSQNLETVLGRALEKLPELRDEFDTMVEDWRNHVRVSADGVLIDDGYAVDKSLEESRALQRDALLRAELFFGVRDSIPTESVQVKAWKQAMWARIPTGAYTCGFCMMLCSRGAVYRHDSAVSAKKRTEKGLDPFKGKYSLNAYHENCDCVMSPVYSWDKYAGKDIVDNARSLYKQFQADSKKDWTGSVAYDFGVWLRKHPDIVGEAPTFRVDKRPI